MLLGLPCAAGGIAISQRVETGATSKVVKPTVNVFPNPYHEVVNFVIETPTAGKASLKVYNSMGQVVANLFQGTVSAGKSKIIRYRVTTTEGNLFYIYEQNGQKVTGNLIRL